MKLTSAVLVAITACAWGQDRPNSVSLDAAIDEALKNNLQLIAQRLQVSVAETQEITARLRPNPVLTVSGQTLDLLGAKYVPTTPFGPNQFNVRTDFPIERGKKREARIGVAKEEKSLAELNVREATRQLIAAVQNAFVAVQQAKEDLKLAQENSDRLQSLVKINESRLAAGDLAQVELDRSRVAALQYSAAVQQAQLRQEQAKLDLALAMGRRSKGMGMGDDFDVSGDLRREAVTALPPALLQSALERRPDYLSGKELQARSRADLRLQLANGKVDYSVGTEFTKQVAYGISGNSMGLYFNVPLPVFNRNQGEIARAQREIQSNGARTNALEAQIGSEVEKAYRQYVVARRLLESVESEMLTKARSVRETTEYSYRRGEASLVEYLDAQRAFNDAVQTFNTARADFARSLYQLDTVTAATVAGK